MDLRTDYREGSIVNIYAPRPGFGPKPQMLGTVEKVTAKQMVVEFVTTEGKTLTRTFRVKHGGVYSTWFRVEKRETH